MNLDIKRRIDAIGHPEAIHFFFQLLNTLLTTASISEDDERLAINVRNDYRKRFSVILNGRLVLSIKDGREFSLMLNDSDLDIIANIPTLRQEAFEKQVPKAKVVYFDFDVLQENILLIKPLWIKSCLEYLPLQEKSQYRIHHINELYKIASSDALLNSYLTSEQANDLSFQQMVNEFRIYLKSEDNVLNDFTVFPLHKEDSRHVWIGDSDKVLKDLLAHYEIIIRRNRIFVEIHFEGSQAEKNIYSQSIVALPDKTEWFRWQNAHSIRFKETYKLSDVELLPKLAHALLYLEENLGDTMRKIKKNMKEVNVKEDFISWFKSKDGTVNNYYTLQFGANPDRLQIEIDNYEQLYKKEFNAELFIITPNDFKAQIEKIKSNIYSDSTEFAKFSNDKSNHRPRAILGKNNYIKFLNEFFGNNTSKRAEMIEGTKKKALNQILFGPPGTGKTFSTVNKAIQIINPEFDLKQDRQIIKDEFDRLIQDGQIVFTTFHQSMSYEDFIEGIKPVRPDDSDKFLKYTVEDGIFKRACANAAYLCYQKYQRSKPNTESYSFDELHDAFITEIEKLLKAKTPPVYKTLTGKDVVVLEVNSNDSIKARAKNSVARRNPAPLTKENLEKLYNKFESVSEIINLAQVKEAVEVSPRITEFYAVFKALKEFEATVFKPGVGEANTDEINVVDIEERLLKFNSGVYSDAIKNFGKQAEQVVLIIDEINRGNVSQIFGELITLVEEDKRVGNTESLEISLPYSKSKFGVPPNLSIIGTMNTADRSVEALDTALRRRFSFEEMPPKYKLPELEYEVYGYAASDILKTINHRIEKLLDRDHAIGHSYFINKDEETIVESFYKCIIPLLQEYFFGDYGKIGLVLGKGFISKKEWDKSSYSFADFDYEGSGDFDEKEVFRIVDYRSDELTVLSTKNQDVVMNFEKALRILMKDSIE